MARNTGPTLAQRRAIIARDQGCCVACGTMVADPDTGDPWRQYSIQHRSARGMGGTKSSAANEPANLLLMCGTGTTGCHGRAEHNPAWAAENGYRVGSWDDPETIPVKHRLYGMVLLTAAGWDI